MAHKHKITDRLKSRWNGSSFTCTEHPTLRSLTLPGRTRQGSPPPPCLVRHHIVRAPPAFVATAGPPNPAMTTQPRRTPPPPLLAIVHSVRLAACPTATERRIAVSRDRPVRSHHRNLRRSRSSRSSFSSFVNSCIRSMLSSPVRSRSRWSVRSKSCPKIRAEISQLTIIPSMRRCCRS